MYVYMCICMYMYGQYMYVCMDGWMDGWMYVCAIHTFGKAAEPEGKPCVATSSTVTTRAFLYVCVYVCILCVYVRMHGFNCAYS